MNQNSPAEYDEETRNILMQGMTAAAAQASMGLPTGDKELAETMRKEREDLARDMERKNEIAQRRRAALVAGEVPGETPVQQSAVEQKAVKKRGKKGMKKQEVARVSTGEFTEAPRKPIAASPSIPEIDQNGVFSQADLDLINSVKSRSAQARTGFLEQHETVHPGAYDARREMPQMPPQPEPAPEYARERLTDPNMMAPQPVPGQVQTSDAGYWGAQHARMSAAAQQEAPRQQSPDIQDAEVSAMYARQSINGQGVPGYGQVNPQFTQPVLPQVNPQFPIPPVNPYAPLQQAPVQDARTAYTEAATVAPVLQSVDTGVPGMDRHVESIYAPKESPVIQPVARFNPARPDKDFEAFTEITGWPSRGLFYEDKVYGQALKTIDAFMLSDADSDDITTILTTILGRRLRGISPEDILTADEEYLMYWLRASSYSETDNALPKVPFKCEHCGHEYRTADTIGMLPNVTFMDLIFSTEVPPEDTAAMHAENGYVEFTTYDGRECDIYLRRRKHDRIVNEYIEGWEKANKKVFPKYKTLPLSIAAVVEIEDCETMTEKVEYIEEYPLSVRSELLRAVMGAQVVSSTKVNIKCPNCGGTATVPYPFRTLAYVATL